MAFRWKTIYEITTHPLTKKRPFSALIRYIRFHCAHLLFPYARIYNWVGPLKLLISRGDAGLVGNVYTGLYDFEEMGFLLHFLRGKDLFVDVGANTGVYSLLAAGCVNSNVIAVEPVSATYRRLKGQLLLNGLEKHVDCVQKAVGVSQDTVYITNNKGTMNHITLEHTENTQAIDTLPLNMISSVCPVMLKIDVEGYELPVLQGAHPFLSDEALKAIIIEINGSGDRHYNFADNEIHELLLSYGFHPYAYDVSLRALSVLSSPRKDQHNTLYLRDLDFVQERLQKARSFAVLGQSF